jgi:hypothetical protein
MKIILEQPISQKRLASTSGATRPGKPIPGVEYDGEGNPVWYSVEESFHIIGNKLITHYGEKIRDTLNKSLTQHGLHPIP